MKRESVHASLTQKGLEDLFMKITLVFYWSIFCYGKYLSITWYL